MQTTVDPTTIGAFVTIILAFLGIAKIMLSQATKDREADRQERIRLAEAIDLMAKNSGKNADSMSQLAQYAKEGNEQSAERNGHLGELIVQSQEQTKKIADVAVESIIKSVGTQHIRRQSVDEQQVKHQSVGKE